MNQSCDTNNKMTKLEKPVTRQTARTQQGREIIITLAPAGSQNEALIGLRLKGKRTQYVVALSKLYIYAADWHAQKERRARKEARAANVPWKTAKKYFVKENSI
jgi:hypothetical protein